MRTVSRQWSDVGFAVRVAITGLTGVMFAMRSLQAVLFDPRYINPGTAADYVAVYSYSAAYLLTAASLLILRAVVRPDPRLGTAILVVAGACAVTGVANGLEDGLGLGGFGWLYVTAVLIATAGMFVIAASLWAGPARGLTFVPALGGGAMALVSLGGGVLALPAWVGFGALLIRQRRRPGTVPADA